MAFLAANRAASLALVCCGLFAATICTGYAGPPLSKEYKVKAVILFNFTRFVEWPDSAFAQTNSPLVIGIVGTDPFGAILDEVVQNESVNAHPIVLRRFSSSDRITDCQMLFISTSESRRAKNIVGRFTNLPVLTISEIENFDQFGIVRLFANFDGKIRMRINLDNAKTADLRISAKLLRVAETIPPNP